MDLGLQDKVVLISGSYRGTGAATAKVFCDEGAAVAIHGHDEGQADSTVESIRRRGGNAIAVHGSLQASESVESIFAQVEEAIGTVDVLVNNYGSPGDTSWADPTNKWIESWDTNVLTGVRMTQRALPAMRERGWGRIIFLGTVGTERPNRRNPDYYSAKAALPVLVRSLAKELNGSGVTSNLVSPGIIATDEVREMLEKRALREGIEGWEEIQTWALKNGSPNLTARLPSPDDIGRYVAFLASEAAWHITGSDFKVDGGALDA
ncbi:MAG TPA: short-chain dehydrogenase [Acidimicrobiaceae bacterium]|nr:short-chain dehydrogenase [Acidimicrobiaceae bacterium]